MINMYNDKIEYFRKIIDNIQIGLINYKLLNVISSNETKLCYEGLEKLVSLISNFNNDNIINELQLINNNISCLIKNYGIHNFEYLIEICLGNDFIEKSKLEDGLLDKYEIIKKYLHPLNYKIINWDNKVNALVKTNKNLSRGILKSKIIDDKQIVDEAEMFECFDLMRVYTNFNMRIYGIKVIIHDYVNNKSLCVNCIFDDIIIDNISDVYLFNKKKNLLEFIKDNNMFKNELFVVDTWTNYYNNLNIKDYLIYSNVELFNKYIYMMNQIKIIENKSINLLVQDFIGSELFTQRSILVQLLLNNNNYEFQYIAYLLYDLLSNETSDSTEQKIIYDSLSWNCKKFFKDAMFKTIEYTNTLSNLDSNKIPLEQQICLMKCKDNVKEKAMQKLKELKSKSEDSGSKARQYLDGLLKIPFGIYKEEYMLTKKTDIINSYKLLLEELLEINNENISNNELEDFINFTKVLLENSDMNMLKIIDFISILTIKLNNTYFNYINNILNKLLTKNKKILLNIIFSLNELSKKLNIDEIKVNKNEKNIEIIKELIVNYIDKNKNNFNILKEILKALEKLTSNNLTMKILNIDNLLTNINYKNIEIKEYINSFNKILDKAIHGHSNAKVQIERIIGQWINGEKSGYCFGFEGPPGVGKTSLAKKGIANCLIDDKGVSRPFAFIALGGSSNGSTLDGHNYTYVGSTWGKIVDILLETKCMNPIIFIDELDKVSRTEHGKEIIGILTHLIDSTQNDTFQDKYFSNIDLDLSKALFIFSYNDVELIDKILLDRIHRIKFDNLKLEDKIIISKEYLIPELETKFGVENIFNFSEDIIKYLIEIYTNEPGVRKLKEILFEIISTINLELLKRTDKYSIPVNINHDTIKDILKDRQYMRYLKINSKAEVGIINGMWANAYGNGGILNIETKLFSTSTFLELKLTGMQGDVMKESMSVAKTLALSLLNKNTLKKMVKEMEETKMQGIHVHVPEGATPKDGPSAGGAITIAIYSLLSNKKIKNTISITGETSLQGKITAIGGLDLKILGAIRAGVDTILYPKENSKDFELFKEKNLEKIKNIIFHEVENINDAIKLCIV